MANKQGYVDLGLSCVDIYKALKRGMDGRELDELSESVREAIEDLKAWVERAIRISCPSAHYYDLDHRTIAEIHKKVKKRGGRHWICRFLHSRDDKDAIPAWNSKLDRILHVFNVCSARSRLASPSLITPLSDRAGCEHPHHRYRYTSGHVENSSGRVEDL